MPNPDENLIRIDISGYMATGKTAVLRILREALQRKGFVVDWDQNGDFDANRSDEFDQKCLEAAQQAGVRILIAERSVPRPIKALDDL